MAVKFTKSPTGAFLLAYSAGDVASFAPELEAAIVEQGYGVYVEGAAPTGDTTSKKDSTTKKK